jgi:hypothetical protein
MEDKKRSWAVVLVAILVLQGCSSIVYNKDTPYDPDFAKGETLFDQIPNNEGESLNRCAGHLDPKDRKPWQTGRC